jgi:hypothetical protein
MKKVEFLETECVGLKVIMEKVERNLDIFMYTASNQQFGRKQANGKFKLVTEEEIAKEFLESGKGVNYKGYIYFQADKMESSEHFKKLNKKQERFTNELNHRINDEYMKYLNGSVYGAIKDITHFPMVQSMIHLYQTGVFSLSLIEMKLQTYLKPEGVQNVLNELHQSVEKAG